MRRRPSVLKENCCLGAGLAVLHCDTVTASPSFGSEGTVTYLRLPFHLLHYHLNHWMKEFHDFFFFF